MSVWQKLSAAVVLVPSVGLLLLGVFLTLRSGVANLGRRKDLRVLVGNLTALLLRLAGYGAGLLAIQRIIGAPMEIGR